MLSFVPRVHWLSPKPRAEAGEKEEGTGNDSAASETVSAQQLRSPGERTQSAEPRRPEPRGVQGTKQWLEKALQTKIFVYFVYHSTTISLLQHKHSNIR